MPANAPKTFSIAPWPDTPALDRENTGWFNVVQHDLRGAAPFGRHHPDGCGICLVQAIDEAYTAMAKSSLRKEIRGESRRNNPGKNSGA
jgi:hypothetical protein